MEITTFVRFHAHPGSEAALAAALHDVHVDSIAEPGCLHHHAYRSIRDPGLFFVHSSWKDEAAFEVHALEPHTVRFLELLDSLIDHELEVSRTVRIE